MVETTMTTKIRQHITEELATANREDLLACRIFIRTCREVDFISREQKIALLEFADKTFRENKEKMKGRATA